MPDYQMSKGEKMYKIRYSINLLPQCGAYIPASLFSIGEDKVIINEDINLLEICSESDELEMFESKILQDFITFKYISSAFYFHLFGLVIHFVYLIVLFLYSSQMYLLDQSTEDNIDAMDGGSS